MPVRHVLRKTEHKHPNDSMYFMNVFSSKLYFLVPVWVELISVSTCLCLGKQNISIIMIQCTLLMFSAIKCISLYLYGLT